MTVFGLSMFAILGFTYYATIEAIDTETNNVIDAETKGLVEQYSLLGLRGIANVIQHRSVNLKAPGAVYLLVNHRYERITGNLSAWPADTTTPADTDEAAILPLAPPEGSEWIHFRISRGEGEEKISRQMRARIIDLSNGYHALVGRDIGERERFREVMRATVALSVFLMTLLAFVSGLLLSRQMLRRVEQIAKTSRQIIDGDLTKRVAVRGTDDEFDRLSSNLNEMFDQIEQLLLGMRAVTDSIAHDLGAPLTRLKNRIEMTLRGAPDMNAYRAALKGAINETDYIRATFDALIDIARVEADAMRLEMAPLNLTDLAEELLELYEPMANEQQLHLEAALTETAPVLASRQTLARAFSNLFDNAIKYTPAGGTIRLNVTAAPKEICFVLEDSGDGIPEADRARVLQRFVRLEKNITTPGTGLGLSLVAAVAKLHRATLELDDNAPGLRVTLTFPRFLENEDQANKRPPEDA